MTTSTFRNYAIAVVSLVLVACSAFSKITKPRSEGEQNSGFTYVPIDPFPVTPNYDSPTCLKPGSHAIVLDALPDNAVRAQVEEIDLSGQVTFGASKIAAQNKTYRITVDYINADTVHVTYWINKAMRIAGDPGNGTQYVDLYAAPPPNLVPGSESYSIYTSRPTDDVVKNQNLLEVNIPVYVGVGLRIIANVQAIGGNANISGIGVLAAEADANLVRGTLVVQTLGINGKSVAAALPIQSELNSTTAQNAVVAVGSIKALLYSPDTLTSARVVGLYLPIAGDQTLVNSLVSVISKSELDWHPQCLLTPAQLAQANAGAAAATTPDASVPPAQAGSSTSAKPTPGGASTASVNSRPSSVEPKQPAQSKGARGAPQKKPETSPQRVM